VSEPPRTGQDASQAGRERDDDVQATIRRQTPADPRRFTTTPGAAKMLAVVTTGHGGYERLDYREVPVPAVGPGEVLLRVLAAGVNATDVNTRLGWYAAEVTAGTGDEAAAATRGGDAQAAHADRADGGWDAPTPFPLIQGTDCCGLVVAANPDGRGQSLLGRRALVRPCMRPHGFGSPDTVWMASDFDGAFAQFVKAPASEVFAVDSDLSDAELGALPCAYATAENMLQRAGVTDSLRVLVTGASGGVGGAAVQLAKLRGAHVTAVAGVSTAEEVRALGADDVVVRGADLREQLGEQSVDVVVDNVSGPGFAHLVSLLRRGGRYVTSGAVAGPVVSFDKRTLYLRDLTLIGCTAWDERVVPDLVAFVERGVLRPAVAAVYPLERIADAQAELLDKRHAGKIVLVPPQPN
jgi:NADPH:quinone reductase-like Zn-dependent oxidoreductase